MNNMQEQITKELWFERNSILQNEEYIYKMLNHFNITKYNFTYNSFNDEDLTITIKGSYLIRINMEDQCYELWGENLALNPSRKIKYHLIKRFYGDDRIYDIFKYINYVKRKEQIRDGTNIKRISNV